MPGAIVDIWQTAANRLYENEDPDQPEMNLRGRVRVTGDGSYEVRTVRPVPYEIPTGGPVGSFLAAFGRHAWRPAHIHFRVDAPGYQPLTTMAYVEGDPWLADDTIGSVKDALVVRLGEDAAGILRTTFDLTLVSDSEEVSTTIGNRL